MRILVVLAVCLAVAAGLKSNPQRIVGGQVINIQTRPSIAALLFSFNLQTYWQSCGGTILNTQSILTAAHCTSGDSANQWRVRVGSSNANSGGVVHNSQSIINHPNYNPWNFDNDIGIIRILSNIVYGETVQTAFIAGTNYNLPDGAEVWAAGWGTTSPGGPSSEQLRQVQIWTVNQATCRNRYSELGYTVTDNMLCSGWLDVGGRDQCQGDSGGPLYHAGNIVVGVCSWGESCALARFPGVNARVSRYTAWIQANA